MFGSFHQSVIFNFGQGLLLQKKLVVDVGSLQRYKDIKAERLQMQLTRWTDKNADIIYSSTSSVQLAKYPIPDTDELADISSMDRVSLTEGNYVQQMHRMLYLEELARMKLVSWYSDYILLMLFQSNLFCLVIKENNTVGTVLESRQKRERHHFSQESIGG